MTETRAETDPPYIQGYYWAKKHWAVKVEPVWTNGNRVFCIGYEDGADMDQFRWFGPVALVEPEETLKDE